MALRNDRSWKVLLCGLLATSVIWMLGNLTPVLFDYVLEGEISRTTAVAFLMGLYGVVSGGLISILSEKFGFLDASDFAKGRAALKEIDGIVAEQIKETESQEEMRDIVEARKRKISLKEYRARKAAEKTAKEVPVEEPPAEEPAPIPVPEEKPPEPPPEPVPIETQPEIPTE